MLCALLRNRVSISRIADGQEFQKMCIEREKVFIGLLSFLKVFH